MGATDREYVKGCLGEGLFPPEAKEISKNQIKWKPAIYFFSLFGGAPLIRKSMCLLPISSKILSSAPQFLKMIALLTPGGSSEHRVPNNVYINVFAISDQAK